MLGVQHRWLGAWLLRSTNAATFLEMRRSGWGEGARKQRRAALLGVVLTSWAAPSLGQDRHETQAYDSSAVVSTPRYVGGGLLGSLVGFGAGHADVRLSF